jgi:phenylalanyl-tRNA synthetase beta chain
MRISEQWLRDWVAEPGTTEELSHRLTMAGLEVDAIEPAAPGFSGVVVGEITACEPHPEAERLTVCSVAGAGSEDVRVVCGAPNAAVGLKAPLATVGAVLADDTVVEETTVKGVASAGMLCSARELGLSEDASGLMRLPADAPVAEDLWQYLGLDDTILELDLTPNRSDCLGMSGVAREVGVVTEKPVGGPACEPVPAEHNDSLPVALSAPEGCPRYLGRVVRGVNAAAASPVWLTERLRRAGVRPLNVAADVTNYVMLELGQPMHAFDLAKLAGGIDVRWARDGESLTLLNGDTVALDGNALVIADHQKPVAMAGIMGGSATAVTEATRDVFLEAAFFAPSAIAGRAREHGLHTDSSHRFERGVDPQAPQRAMARATALLTAIAGGQPGEVTDASQPDHLPATAQVSLRASRLKALLGVELGADAVRGILERLGMDVADAADGWRVGVPSWRFDIEREVDLVEEIARIRGYDNLPVTRAAVPLAMGEATEHQVPRRRLRRALVDRGYQEAITYSFVPRELNEALDPDHPAMALANPLSEELGVMRTTLWPGLVRAVQYNRNRQNQRVRLFETGQRFRGQPGALEQTPMLAGMVTGRAQPEHWDGQSRSVDFFDIKADVEALLGLGGDASHYRFTPASHAALHPGQSAQIWRDGEEAGWVGALHPRLVSDLELDGPVYAFELALPVLQRAELPRFRAVSRYPAIRRDLAVVVEEQVSAGELARVATEAAGAALRDWVIFDVYRGKGVPDGSKSVAMGLILQDVSRTLTEPEIDAMVTGVVSRLKQELNAELRE